VTPSIQLYGGTWYDFTSPSPVAIETLAHALCRINRFTGHTSSALGYSVAQHSLNVMALLPRELQLQGLMHDAHEALVGDVAAPLKALLPDYRYIERRVEKYLRMSFGLPVEFDPVVKRADLWMLHAESAHFQTHTIPAPDDTEGINLNAPLYLKPRRLASLKGQFLYHFYKLTRPPEAPATGGGDFTRAQIDAARGNA
jgi:hypothetical protein